MHKLIIAFGFIIGLFLVLYGFFLTATTTGVLVMLFGVASLVVSLFLYNKFR